MKYKMIDEASLTDSHACFGALWLGTEVLTGAGARRSAALAVSQNWKLGGWPQAKQIGCSSLPLSENPSLSSHENLLLWRQLRERHG
jgi:hypothetical protein